MVAQTDGAQVVMDGTTMDGQTKDGMNTVLTQAQLDKFWHTALNAQRTKE